MPRTRLELVQIQTDDRKDLTGCIAESDGANSVLVAIVVHGAGQNFYCPWPLSTAISLREQGLSVLSINTRGHDIVATESDFDDVAGTAWEHFPDCVQDLDAGMKLARQLWPHRPTILVGHSLGALKVAYFTARASPPDVLGQVLFAPVISMGSVLRFRIGQAYDSLVEEARRRVDVDQGQTLLCLGTRWPYAIAASALVHYASRSPDELLLNALRSTKIASLIVRDGSRKPEGMQDFSNVTTSDFPRADHFFKGLALKTTKAVVRWASSLVG